MFGKLSRLVAGLAMVIVAGCGAASSYDNCLANCDSLRRCNYSTDVDHQNCVNNCTSNKGSLSDNDAALAKKCSNAGDILSKSHDCYANTPCLANGAIYGAQVISCLASASQCVAQ